MHISHKQVYMDLVGTAPPGVVPQATLDVINQLKVANQSSRASAFDRLGPVPSGSVQIAGNSVKNFKVRIGGTESVEKPTTSTSSMEPEIVKVVPPPGGAGQNPAHHIPAEVGPNIIGGDQQPDIYPTHEEASPAVFDLDSVRSQLHNAGKQPGVLLGARFSSKLLPDQVNSQVNSNPYYWANPNIANNSAQVHVPAQSNQSSESTPSNSVAQDHVLMSRASTLANHLSPDIINRILTKQYVDFSKLLPPKTRQLDKANLKDIKWDLENQKMVCQDEQSPPLSSFNLWDKAFRIYFSVYIIKYPEEAQALLAYEDLIREAATLHARHKLSDWRTYDIEFRVLKAKDQSVRWDLKEDRNWNFYIVLPLAAARDSSGSGQSTSKRNNNNQNNPHKPKKQRFVSNKACRDFNKKEGCTYNPCNFTHKCEKCGNLGHPKFRCHAKPKGSAGGQAQD